MKVDDFFKHKRIVIFGAGVIAKSVFFCLSSAPFFVNVECFMVSDKSNNPQSLFDKPIVEPLEDIKFKKNTLVLVAVTDKFYEDIYNNLCFLGYENIVPVTFESEFWEILRIGYFKELFRVQDDVFLLLDEVSADVGECEDISEVKIYRASCHVDKKLQVSLRDYDYEKVIQVGSVLTDVKISELQDNKGDNISNKNREYCELTALYWIWKNDKSRYVGLCHYRRHFQIQRKILATLERQGIDVVLTVPVLNIPSVREVYQHDHDIMDWDIMLKAIEILQPQYRETAEKLQSGIYYYAYNMFIMRKEILDDYCAWLFPILSYCEEKCGKKENIYQNRYIGFLAERLLGIFLLHHKNQYKIVHARKIFLN